MNIERLANDQIKEIMKHLSDEDLGRFCQISKKINSICEDEHFWKTRKFEKFGLSTEARLSEGKFGLLQEARLSEGKFGLLQEARLSEKNNEKKKYEIMKGLDKIASLWSRNMKRKKNIEELFNIYDLSLDNLQIMSIPKEIGLLRNLKILDLSGNKLSFLPKEIGLLENLVELYVEGNELTYLPKEIGNLKNIKSLWFSDNNLEDIPNFSSKSRASFESPKEMGKLKKLKTIDLSENQFTIFPNEICTENIETIWLGDNKLTFIPEYPLKYLKHLKNLNLEDNELTKENMDNIQFLLPNVEIISIYGYN